MRAFNNRKSSLILCRFLMVYNVSKFKCVDRLQVAAVICGSETVHVEATRGVVCETYETCANCIKESALCDWSTEKQSCHRVVPNSTMKSSTDVKPRQCPKFSTSYQKNEDPCTTVHVIKVKITDHERGFTETLRTNGPVTCHLDNLLDTNPLINDDEIVCRMQENSQNENPTNMTIKNFAVNFGGVRLRFDDESHNKVIGWKNGNVCNDKSTVGQLRCVSCFWEDNLFQIHGEWCSVSNGTRPQIAKVCRNYSARYRNDSSCPFVEFQRNIILRVRCPMEFQIESVEPTHGVLMNGTIVNVVVKNHQILVNDLVVRVKVAGHSCELMKIDGDTISCSINSTTSYKASVDIAEKHEGPMQVSYWPLIGSSEPVLMVQSDRVFRVSYIKDVLPTCGPKAGGTVLRIRGEFPIAPVTVRVFIGDKVECAVLELDENQIACKTGPSDDEFRGRVRLEFADGGSARPLELVADSEYAYVDEPTVDAGQRFEGILSGGTRIAVRGRHFACVANASICVTDGRDPSIRHTGQCVVKTDTYMECRSPAIAVPPQPHFAASASNMAFAVQANFADRQMMPLTILDTASYALFSDPVATDFEFNDSTTVIVHGQHLNRGYPPNDLSVRSNQSPDVHGTACNVTLVTPRRIVCQIPVGRWPDNWWSVVSTTNAAVDHHRLLVAFGVALSYRIETKQSAAAVIFSRMPFKPFLYTLLAAFTLACLFIAFVVAAAIVMSEKRTQVAYNLPTETQLLCESCTNNSVVMSHHDVSYT